MNNFLQQMNQRIDSVTQSSCLNYAFEWLWEHVFVNFLQYSFDGFRSFIDRKVPPTL